MVGVYSGFSKVAICDLRKKFVHRKENNYGRVNKLSKRERQDFRNPR